MIFHITTKLKLSGARSHTTKANLKYLREIFGDRIISNFCKPKWPPRSPDLSPLDYWFWACAENFIEERDPEDFFGLKQALADFIATLSEQDIRRAVQHFRKRAQACKDVDGEHFEHLLKKKNGVVVDDEEISDVEESGDAVGVENEEEITSSIEILNFDVESEDEIDETIADDEISENENLAGNGDEWKAMYEMTKL